MSIKSKLINAHLDPQQLATTEIMHKHLSSAEFYQLNQHLDEKGYNPASNIIESFTPTLQTEIDDHQYQTANVTNDQIYNLQLAMEQNHGDLYYYYEDTYQLDDPKPLTIDDVINIAKI